MTGSAVPSGEVHEPPSLGGTEGAGRRPSPPTPRGGGCASVPVATLCRPPLLAGCSALTNAAPGPAPAMASAMRAAVYRRFGGPVRVETVPRPACPPDGVVLAVRACGVCRSDHHGYMGHDGDVVAHGLPFVPGHELSGVVEQVGEDVRRFRVGDAVAVPFILSCGGCDECFEGRATTCLHQEQPGFTQWGGFAQAVAIQRADRNLCPIPSGVGFAAAAAVGCRVTTAYRAVVEQSAPRRGATLAVFGAGGVGLSAVLVARAFVPDVTICAIDASGAALDVARELGVDVAVRMEPGGEPADAAAALDAALGGAPVDISIDAGGFADTAQAALLATRRGGTMCQVGLPLAHPIGFTGDQLARIAGRELRVVGSHGADASVFPSILAAVADKRLPVDRLVRQELTLEQGADLLTSMDAAAPPHPGVSVITNFA